MNPAVLAVAAPEDGGQQPVATIEGNDMLREMRWLPTTAAFDYAPGTKLYAEPAVAAPIEVAPAPQPERNIKRPDALTQFVQRLLSTPGCERLKEWAEIGPVQRAAVEQLVSLVAPAPAPAPAQQADT